MTTTLKPLRRETFSSIRERGRTRPIVIELNSTYVRVRLKKSSRFYVVTYDQIFVMGARNAAEAHRRERVEAKKKARSEK